MKIQQRSLRQDAPAKGIWATAGKQGGHYGVVLGEGKRVVGFIPELLLTDDNLEKVRTKNPIDAELIRRAWEDLTRIKAEADYRATQHPNG
jgi:hypothetical protein